LKRYWERVETLMLDSESDAPPEITATPWRETGRREAGGPERPAPDPDRPLTDTERLYLESLAARAGAMGESWLPAIATAATYAEGASLRFGLKELIDRQARGDV